MDVELSEEDMMMQAIALSLGGEKKDGATKTKSEPEPEPPKLVEDVMFDIQSFSNEINSFTENILQGCLNLMDEIPTTAHGICDLIMAITRRNGQVGNKI